MYQLSGGGVVKFCGVSMLVSMFWVMLLWLVLRLGVLLLCLGGGLWIGYCIFRLGLVRVFLGLGGCSCVVCGDDCSGMRKTERLSILLCILLLGVSWYVLYTCWLYPASK